MLVDLISLAANHLLWCVSAYVYCAKEFQCMCRWQDNSVHYTVQVSVTFSVGTVNYTTHYTIALQHDISMLNSLAYSYTANFQLKAWNGNKNTTIPPRSCHVGIYVVFCKNLSVNRWVEIQRPSTHQGFICTVSSLHYFNTRMHFN